MRPVFVVALACAAFLGALGLIQMRRQLAVAKEDASTAAKQSAMLSATLEEQLTWMRKQLQQQSQAIQKLRKESTRHQAVGEFANAIAEEDFDNNDQLEQIWAALEPFAERHLEDWEERRLEDDRLRLEQDMEEMRERRIQKLAEKLGLNPFQTEQVARINQEFEFKRRDLIQGEDPSLLDDELANRMKALKEEEHDQLARILTPEQLGQYPKSGQAVLGYTDQDNDLGLESVSISAEVNAAIEADIGVRQFEIDSEEGPPGVPIIPYVRENPN